MSASGGKDEIGISASGMAALPDHLGSAAEMASQGHLGGHRARGHAVPVREASVARPAAEGDAVGNTPIRAASRRGRFQPMAKDPIRPAKAGVLPGTPNGEPSKGPGIVPGTPGDLREPAGDKT